MKADSDDGSTLDIAATLSTTVGSGPDARYLEQINRALRAATHQAGDGYPHLAVRLVERIVDSLTERARHLPEPTQDLVGLVDEAMRMHHTLCRDAGLPPEELIPWLLHVRQTSPDIPLWTITQYAPIIGPDGLAMLREELLRLCGRLPVVGLGETQPLGRRRLALLGLAAELAAYGSDVDLTVAFLATDLSTGWQYLRIATTLQEAGRSEDALVWVERGLTATRGRGAGARLVDLAVDECLRLGWTERAVQFRRASFGQNPGLDTYLRLRGLAEQVGHWTKVREWAVSVLRENSVDAQRNSVLVRVLLWEGEAEAAWQAAQRAGCTDELWAQLAHVRAQSDLGDAITVYRRLVERSLSAVAVPPTQTAPELAEVPALLQELRDLFDRAGRPDDFAGYLDTVKRRHQYDLALLEDLQKHGL
ncbi:hypothetical protein D5S17_16665 [Pseudonocardiaceae bacterium YIM PH 21723]|nr:hypothetical protein D5S17_16665 [Pseudonocardiaceae bacterium YIM PH 21723]